MAEKPLTPERARRRAKKFHAKADELGKNPAFAEHAKRYRELADGYNAHAEKTAKTRGHIAAMDRTIGDLKRTEKAGASGQVTPKEMGETIDRARGTVKAAETHKNTLGAPKKAEGKPEKYASWGVVDQFAELGTPFKKGGATIVPKAAPKIGGGVVTKMRFTDAATAQANADSHAAVAKEKAAPAPVAVPMGSPPIGGQKATLPQDHASKSGGKPDMAPKGLKSLLAKQAREGTGRTPGVKGGLKAWARGDADHWAQKASDAHHARAEGHRNQAEHATLRGDHKAAAEHRAKEAEERDHAQRMAGVASKAKKKDKAKPKGEGRGPDDYKRDDDGKFAS